MQKVRRVGGAQAEMALHRLGLIKVDRNGAKRFFDAGIEFVIVPSKVNAHHFFEGWGLAHRVDSARYKSEGWTFERFLNNWSHYNENSETGKAAFFVKRRIAETTLMPSVRRKPKPRMLFNERREQTYRIKVSGHVVRTYPNKKSAWRALVRLSKRISEGLAFVRAETGEKVALTVEKEGRLWRHVPHMEPGEYAVVKPKRKRKPKPRMMFNRR